MITVEDLLMAYASAYDAWLDPEAERKNPTPEYAELIRQAVSFENEKLRELVADMWWFTGAACKKYPRLFDPVAQGGQMVQLNALDSFEQRMRELGVEV